jgi:hypothetical protein
LIGTVAGGVAVYYAKQPMKLATQNYGIFRKSWMSLPMYSFAFMSGYTLGTYLPQRIFPKFIDRTNYKKNHGLTFEELSSENDLVKKFRIAQGD